MQMYAISRVMLLMAPHEENQHCTEMRKKEGIHLQGIVIQRGLPSLNRKYELYVTKRGKSCEPSWVRQVIGVA